MSECPTILPHGRDLRMGPRQKRAEPRRLLAVSHLDLDNGRRIRIISARPATASERRYYEEAKR
jgi:uncharacterized DUF497 family protein